MTFCTRLRCVNGKDARDWAEEVFGHADLGDSRRTRRLVHLAAEAARHPAGKVLDVCKTSASRQGAYDFLNNRSVTAEAIQSAVTISTARTCGSEPFCFVVVDGTSLTLTDWRRAKGFGAVGSTSNGARGLKVMNAYAVAADGTPIGILGQKWWRREAGAKRSDCADRTVDEKETRHWRDAIQGSELCLSAAGTRAWFQLDSRRRSVRDTQGAGRERALVHGPLHVRTSLPAGSAEVPSTSPCCEQFQGEELIPARHPGQVRPPRAQRAHGGANDKRRVGHDRARDG